jgi:hypothetical protein
MVKEGIQDIGKERPKDPQSDLQKMMDRLAELPPDVQNAIRASIKKHVDTHDCDKCDNRSTCKLPDLV